LTSIGCGRMPKWFCQTDTPTTPAQNASETIISQTGTVATPAAATNTSGVTAQDTRRANTLVMGVMW
jgi:hypothetical protein